MPLDQLAAYGAGIQVHAEDLAAHLAGRERCDADARWNELLPAYRDLEANAGQYGSPLAGHFLTHRVAYEREDPGSVPDPVGERRRDGST